MHFYHQLSQSYQLSKIVRIFLAHPVVVAVFAVVVVNKVVTVIVVVVVVVGRL